jgi:hypothetical protein
MINYHALRLDNKYLNFEYEFENYIPVILLADDKEAKRLRDKIGCTMAEIVEFELKEVKKIEKPKRWGVYIISEKTESLTDTKHFKIGYSIDPIKRVKQLQTGHPVRLGLEGWFDFETEESARKYERQLHGDFQSIKARGEWFVWCDGIEAFIHQAHHKSNIFTRFIS